MRDKRKTGRGAEKGHVEILKEALIPFGLSLIYMYYIYIIRGCGYQYYR